MTRNDEVPSGRDGASGQQPEQIVFDEDFIRGGVHEPPPRTREAIARYGTGRSSWRQSAPTHVVGPKARRPRSGHPRRGKLPLILSVVAAVVVIGPVLFLNGYTTRGVPNVAGVPHAPVKGIITAPTGVSITSSPFTGAVVKGIAPGDPAGSCYLSATTTGQEELSMLDCARPHTYELISQETAQGADRIYPDSTYWNNTVGPACYRDQLAYMNKIRDAWPPAVTSRHFQPSPAGWASGDRSVFCMATSDPPTTGSVKG